MTNCSSETTLRCLSIKQIGQRYIGAECYFIEHHFGAPRLVFRMSKLMVYNYYYYASVFIPHLRNFRVIHIEYPLVRI